MNSFDNFQNEAISFVEDGLWIGCLSATLNLAKTGFQNISHILTVDTCPLPQNIESMSNIKTTYLKATDLPYEDLISHFDRAYNFITNGQENGGNVLVHCRYGVSRSATVVIAFLMKKRGITYKQAYDCLKDKRSIVGPNEGFKHQLIMYENMGCQINRGNVQYKLFRLRVTSNKVAKVKIVPQDCMDVIKPDPALLSVNPQSSVYRCKKCRKIVCSSSNVIAHYKNEKLSWKSKRWSETAKDADKQCHAIYFIEPMSWIDSVVTTESGKILCPKCRNKLGSFSWTMGTVCPCGSKVVPSFYLTPSKVDYSNIVQNVQMTI